MRAPSAQVVSRPLRLMCPGGLCFSSRAAITTFRHGSLYLSLVLGIRKGKSEEIRRFGCLYKLEKLLPIEPIYKIHSVFEAHFLFQSDRTYEVHCSQGIEYRHLVWCGTK